MKRTLIALATSATLAAGSLAVDSGVAHATKYDSERGTWTIDETFDLCGLTVHHVEVGTFNWHGFAMTGPSAGVFKNHTINDFTGTFTNIDNGRYITEAGHNNGHGIGTAPVVYGNVHDVTVLEQGWDVLRDLGGKVLARSTGSYTVEYLFDDGGDSVPGGSVVGEPTVTRISGLHPLDDATEQEFCALITPALQD